MNGGIKKILYPDATGSRDQNNIIVRVLNYQEKHKRCKGFTLPELLIATVILMLVFVGMLLGYIRGMELSEMSRNSSRAILLAKSRVEQIRNTPFNQLVATYDNTAFSTVGLNGIGVSYVDDADPELFQITVTVCWREKNGRIIGEDSDLDGILDPGEDMNGNGMLDSYAQIVTQLYGG